MKLLTFTLFLIFAGLHSFGQNMFRIYNQPPAPVNYPYMSCVFYQPVKTSDGGFLLTAEPWQIGLHLSNSNDFMTIKTNSVYVPSWKKRMTVKARVLPSGRLITSNFSVDNQVFPVSQLSKLSNSGNTIWTQSISIAQVSSTMTEVMMSDFIVTGNKITCVGYINDYDPVLLGSWQTNGFIAEYDTSGILMSPLKRSTPTNSLAATPKESFDRIFRNASGEFIISDFTNHSIHKVSSTYTSIWSRTCAPKWYDLLDAHFMSNGDMICLLGNNRFWTGDTSSIIARISPAGNVIFAKEIKLYALFSGMEKTQQGKFVLTGVLPRINPNDTIRNVVLMVDSNANFLWARKQIESIGISKALYANNQILFTTYTKHLVLQSGDLNGNFACTNKPITVPITAFTLNLSPVLLSINTTTAVIFSQGITYTNTTQSYKDTCGGSGVSLIETGLNQLKIGIWPNPTSGRITLDSEEELSGKEVEIISLTGQKIRTLTLTSNEINLEDLDPGVYFLSFPAWENAIIAKKVLISR